MKFYHGTSKENWERIQEQGFLLNCRGPNCDPVTYLAVSRKEAEHYGPIVLRVKYDPGSGKDNWQKGCWQVRVYTKILLVNIRELKS